MSGLKPRLISEAKAAAGTAATEEATADSCGMERKRGNGSGNSNSNSNGNGNGNGNRRSRFPAGMEN